MCGVFWDVGVCEGGVGVGVGCGGGEGECVRGRGGGVVVGTIARVRKEE